MVIVDIPLNTPSGTEVLNATILPQNIRANYIWDQTFSIILYEEYIKSISETYFSKGFYAGTYGGIQIITEGKTRIILNYNETRNWVVEYDDAVTGLKNFYTFGSAKFIIKNS